MEQFYFCEQGTGEYALPAKESDLAWIMDRLQERKQVGRSWRPMRFASFDPMEARKPPQVDMPFFMQSVPLLRSTAKPVWERFADPATTEFLPIRLGSEKAFLMHVMTPIAGVVDVERSKPWRLSDGEILTFHEYVLRPEKLKGLDIFGVAEELGSRLLVSDRLVRALREENLTGTVFRSVWPLPDKIQTL